MADTINISDKVLMAQSRTKTSQRLLTYIRQAPGLTPLHSSVLRDLNEPIFTPFRIHGKQEKFQNNGKRPLFFPSLSTRERHQPVPTPQQNCRLANLHAMQG